MRRATIVTATLLLAFGSIAESQQRVVVRGGGSDEAATRDWPRPEIRSTLSDDQKIAAIAEYGQRLAAGDIFSGVLLVAKDGKPVLTRAWGRANEKEPNTPDTKFNIGSINKDFTRQAIRQLEAAQKLTMSDTIRKHLPDYPSDVADRITIAQLLDHSSGLGDIFGERYMSAPPSKLHELRDFLPLFADQPLAFEPGTSRRYSNAGYIVLGLIIEKHAGMTYRDYVQKNIFAPAGMKDTGFFAIDEVVPNRATGFTKRGPDGPLAERRTNIASLPGRPSSAGGAFSTAMDLLRFVQWTRARGVGLAGGTSGANAMVEADDRWVVIGLSNYDPPSAEFLVENAMKIVRGGEAQEEARRSPPTAPDDIRLPGPVAVPFTPQGHVFGVQAMVNGKGPYRFTVDTGAGGMLVVMPELAKELHLPQIGEARSGDPSGKNVTTRPIVAVDSVQIGNARFEGVHASVGARLRSDLGDGVIGLGLFGELSVTLDFPKKELRLTMRPVEASNPNAIAFTRDHRIPTIEVDLAGTPLRAHIDTGSPSFLNIPSSTKVTFAGEPRVVGRARTVANEFEIRAAELQGQMRIGSRTVTNPTVEINDIFPVGNIGMKFLGQYALTFDLKNSRVAIE